MLSAHHSLRLAPGFGLPGSKQLTDHRGPEQLQCQFRGYAALVKGERSAGSNHGACGVIRPLACEALDEATFDSFEPVAQGREGDLLGPPD